MTWMVLGAGLSGLAATELLRSKNYNVILCNNKAPTQKTLDHLDRLSVPFNLIDHQALFPNHVTEGVILSPGFSLTHPYILEAKKRKIAVYSEVEFALSFFSGKIIGVTGTNGKSTTVSMIFHILKKSGYSVELAGNIGTPVSQVIMNSPCCDILVLELSSYQLEHSKDLFCHIGAFINFSPDHLERHGTLKNYFHAKWKLIEKSVTIGKSLVDKNVFDKASSFFPHLSPSFLDHLLVIQNKDAIDFIEKNSNIFDSWHNKVNAYYAIKTINLLTGNSMLSLLKHLESFVGLPHRFEFCGHIMSQKVVNDSKSTNVNSTCVALSNLKEPSTIFLGGLGKNESFVPLLQYKNKIKNLVLFGPQGAQIQSELSSFPSTIFSNLGDALDFFLSPRNKNNITSPILFSPGCASFDEFQNFEKRGDYFKSRIGEFTSRT